MEPVEETNETVAATASEQAAQAPTASEQAAQAPTATASEQAAQAPTASEQAAQAPTVASGGAPTRASDRSLDQAEVERQHTAELAVEREEHNDRRVNPRLPDPEAVAAADKPGPALTDPSTQTFLDGPSEQKGDLPADQVASDGDRVVDGLPDDENKEAGA